ncbi:hypothetical protein PM082_014471 [Marasmius tenuissimus]|nr:hypothetical protein PM082_014471 [Marasmius tenuissimus]
MLNPACSHVARLVNGIRTNYAVSRVLPKPPKFPGHHKTADHDLSFFCQVPFRFPSLLSKLSASTYPVFTFQVDNVEIRLVVLTRYGLLFAVVDYQGLITTTPNPTVIGDTPLQYTPTYSLCARPSPASTEYGDFTCHRGCSGIDHPSTQGFRRPAVQDAEQRTSKY